MLFVSMVFGIALLGADSADGPPRTAEEIFASIEERHYSPPKLIKTRVGKRCPRGLRYTPRQTTTEDQATPIESCFPSFPRKCSNVKNLNNAVELVFDVTPEGFPENIRILRTTERCLNTEAARSVSYWRYAPTDTGFKDYTTTLTFHLSG